MTTETDLAIDSLRRDLERWRNSVDEAERQRIRERMVDTVNNSITDTTPHDQVMEIINIINEVIS